MARREAEVKAVGKICQDNSENVKHRYFRVIGLDFSHTARGAGRMTTLQDEHVMRPSTTV
jgi:hypothetical protein